MSHKIGIPILKGSLSGRFAPGSTHINLGAAAREAVPDAERGTRSCRDVDYDPALTRTNLFYSDVNTYQKATEERQRHLEDYIARTGRTVRKDAVMGISGIIKPDIEIMESLSQEEQLLLLQRSFDVLLELLDKTHENIIYATVHMDEGNPHIHFELDPITKDDRWSAKEIFQLKTYSALNEQLPAILNERYGYSLDACKRAPDAPKRVPTYTKEEYVTRKLRKQQQELKDDIRASQETLGYMTNAVNTEALKFNDLQQQHVSEAAEILQHSPNSPFSQIHDVLVKFASFLTKRFHQKADPELLVEEFEKGEIVERINSQMSREQE